MRHSPYQFRCNNLHRKVSRIGAVLPGNFYLLVRNLSPLHRTV